MLEVQVLHPLPIKVVYPVKEAVRAVNPLSSTRLERYQERPPIQLKEVSCQDLLQLETGYKID